MTLPPYNQDATCPKCGGATRVSGWMPSRRAEVEALAGEWPHEPGKVVWLPEGAPPVSSLPPYGMSWDEHIVRTCTRCGYAWPEAPMDHIDDANKMVAAQLAEFADDLASKQEPLPDDMQRVWDENRDKLYADSEAPMDKESA